uniref:NAD(P)-binding domain-containing protein n=1 Tax=Eutreptiella gymnastica TaxID=73025 RepID=A0A7S4C7P4_9EUGL
MYASNPTSHRAMALVATVLVAACAFFLLAEPSSTRTQLLLRSVQVPSLNQAGHSQLNVGRSRIITSLASEQKTPLSVEQLPSTREAQQPFADHQQPRLGALARLSAPLMTAGAILCLGAVFQTVYTWFSSPRRVALATTGGTKGRKVVVTGAGGRTGKLVTQKLINAPEFSPIGLVNSAKSLKTLASLGLGDSAVRNASVTGPVDDLAEAFAGAEAVVICTSAVPKIQFFSIIKILLAKLFCQKPGRPTFSFAPGGTPEEVDWIGQKNQIDAAKAAGVSHVVIVSSMGGTQPDNFLNTIGKQEDGTGGDILLWKRKAEKYLIDSGLKYTIIHPGGLLDKAGGEREIVFGVDDKLLQEDVRSIPREDVAEVCVQSLLQPGAINRSFDIISRENGKPTKDWEQFFGQSGENCDYTVMTSGVSAL